LYFVTAFIVKRFRVFVRRYGALPADGFTHLTTNPFHVFRERQRNIMRVFRSLVNGSTVVISCLCVCVYVIGVLNVCLECVV
jgi:hypothetical protein